MSRRIHNIQHIDELLASKRVFIFDFDGTVADTETLHWAAYNTCLLPFGIVLQDKDIRRYIGHTEMSIYEMIKADFNIKFGDDVFFQKRISTYLELVRQNHLQPFPFFTYLLGTFRPTVSFTILSSQRSDVIHEILGFWGLRDVFSKEISVATGQLSKSIVLKDVFGYFGVPNEDAVLFEDTDRNLKVAQNEGILAVGIEHRYNKALLQHGDVIVGSIT